MTATELLEQLAREGVRVTAEGEQLIVEAPESWSNDPLLHELMALKPKVLKLLQLPTKPENAPDEEAEILWRVEAMKKQLANHTGKYFPTLTAGENLTGRLGYCFSCGEELQPEEGSYTCRLCRNASYAVLGLL